MSSQDTASKLCLFPLAASYKNYLQALRGILRWHSPGWQEEFMLSPCHPDLMGSSYQEEKLQMSLVQDWKLVGQFPKCFVLAASWELSSTIMPTGAGAQSSTAHSDSICAFELQPVIMAADSGSSPEEPPQMFLIVSWKNDICSIVKLDPTSTLQGCDRYPEFSCSLNLPAVLIQQAVIILKHLFIKNITTKSKVAPGAAEYPSTRLCCWYSLP